jgi:hypothetical protein
LDNHVAHVVDVLGLGANVADSGVSEYERQGLGAVELVGDFFNKYGF